MYLTQECKIIEGHPLNFVSEIKCVEDCDDFEKIGHVNQRGPQGFTVKKIEISRWVSLAQLNLTTFKLEPTAPNMSQHIATWWPNARNQCCDMLRGHVAIVWPGLKTRFCRMLLLINATNSLNTSSKFRTSKPNCVRSLVPLPIVHSKI